MGLRKWGKKKKNKRRRRRSPLLLLHSSSPYRVEARVLMLLNSGRSHVMSMSA